MVAALDCGRKTGAPGEPGREGNGVDVGGGRFCDGACVVETFRQLAPIYRPSGEEGALRDRLVLLANGANDTRWDARSGKLEILAPDAVGNFLIRVPATGRFARRALPPVALQAHMDMVLAATAVAPGGDLKAHFRANPIEIEVQDGKLRSVGGKTSIGADNTVGCALMLRYALDPTIEHPPMELVFTVHEEVGLKGAQEYDTGALALRAPVMVNLDGFDAGKLIHGSQGSTRRSVSGSLPTQLVKAGKLIKVTVTRLLGGHSGADIHEDRLNGVIALAAIVRTALANGTLGVVSAVAGDLAGLNKIPTDLELHLSAPAGFDLAGLRASTERATRQAVGAHLAEAANPAVTISVSEAPLPAGPVTALTADAARRLVETVLAIERARPPLNGVITKKVGYPNDVNTSSNLGVLDLRPDGGGALPAHHHLRLHDPVVFQRGARQHRQPADRPPRGRVSRGGVDDGQGDLRLHPVARGSRLVADPPGDRAGGQGRPPVPRGGRAGGRSRTFLFPHQISGPRARRDGGHHQRSPHRQRVGHGPEHRRHGGDAGCVHGPPGERRTVPHGGAAAGALRGPGQPVTGGPAFSRCQRSSAAWAF